MEKTPEQIAQEAAAAAATAGQDPAVVVEAAREAPPPGATQEAVEAVQDAASVSPPDAAARLAEVEAKLVEYKAAVDSYIKALKADLEESDTKLLDTLSEKDPLRWLGLFAKLKEAGKIGKPTASASSAPAADRSRISSESGQASAPQSIEEARAGALGALQRM